MTKEEKELLLKDLCCRLLYKVKIEINSYYTNTLIGIDGKTISTERGINYSIDVVKPYLRPMSSMTKEEMVEYRQKQTNYEFGYFDTHASIDWLNAHHFDYRGLIPMGLALEAPEGMYN